MDAPDPDVDTRHDASHSPSDDARARAESRADSTSDLLRLLDIVPVADSPGAWTGATPIAGERSNLFGGVVAAQALRAAHLSVGLDRVPHSLHLYFLRTGRPGEPLHIVVDATRDGRSFSSRRVEVRQADGAILTMLASFQVPESGHEYQIAPADVPVPGPQTPTESTGHATGMGGTGPFDFVEAAPGPAAAGSLDWSSVRYWARTRGNLGEDPGLHACAIVAMGDLRTGGPPRMARSGSAAWTDGALMMTSIDYAMWFRRPALADQWLLFDLRAAGNSGARGLTTATIHDAQGRQVASYAMEMLMREIG